MHQAVYTNNTRIPLALAVYLATDFYDFDPSAVSATTLLKPTRQLVLKDRLPPEKRLIDLSSLIQSSLGSSIHDGIEKAWLNNYETAMQLLGYPSDIIERIIINPNPETLRPEQIPVFMEQRHYREITVQDKTFKISGKMDFIAEGVVQDFKSTIAYTYKKSTKIDDFQLQGSIYRWLAPHLITGDYIHIHYIFMDWAAYKVNTEKNYPPNRCHSVKVPLLSLKETENFIVSKLKDILHQKNLPEQEITFCTDKELWREPDQYKYYKNPNNAGVPGKRSTKNFNAEDFDDSPAKAREAAYALLAKNKNVGTVLEVKGKVKACNYCPAFHGCTQKDQYIKDGTLVLTKD